jgi:hypothetical protein
MFRRKTRSGTDPASGPSAPRIAVHGTPNPNSLKFVAEGRAFLSGGMASFRSAGEAAAHPLGARLFALPGVANVFIVPQFLTVTKEPAADWDALIPEIERVLQAHFAEADPA